MECFEPLEAYLKDDLDSPWKDMLDIYFPAFMELLFPEAHAAIDWAAGYENLDKELQKVVRDAEIGRRLADKLVKVTCLDGKELVVLVHSEVQGQVDSTFAKRMFTYHYRILDRYDKPVVSLAVLGDASKSWRPQSYDYDLWGCSLDFRFPMVKLLDCRKRWQDLAASRNPFAIVVMTHLKYLETRNNALDRKNWKMQLTRGMYEKGFAKQDILNIFNFIDWLMTLPEAMEEQFEVELEAYEKEHKMPYVTAIERRGIAKGIQQGMQQGRTEEARRTLRRILNHRFGGVDKHLDSPIDQASIDQLEAWIDASLDAPSAGSIFDLA